MRKKRSIRARAPAASSPTVRHVMQRNTGHETDPERRLRSALHRLGLRFRKDVRPEPNLRISADIVFPRQKICIFVDGCFWHGCPLHFETPKTHSAWWREKILDNKARDARQSNQLRAYGWTVKRYWEHELRASDLTALCSRIERVVRTKRD